MYALLVNLTAVFIILYLWYLLFIKGYAWVILLVVFGVLGGKTFILCYFPSSSATIATLLNYSISYAFFISFIIVFLGILFLIKFCYE